MKVYISGKITGEPNYMEKFCKVQKKLEEAGIDVVNPALVNSMLPKNTKYEEYMQMCITMMNMCSTVYMMQGWEESTGARFEYDYAMITGKTVLFQKDGEDVFKLEGVVHGSRITGA